MKNLNQLDFLMKGYADQASVDDKLVHTWGWRAVMQLMFAVKLTEADSQQAAFSDRVDEAIEQAWKTWQEEGALTKKACLEIEQTLAPLAEAAKSYTLLCIGHAHIDMNWMWSYDETVSITLDTFRTVLSLMDEYPEFTFAQSQASVYEIVAKYDPEMLQQIKRRIHEGRWEVTASTWVEADRNMPNAESMARHFLYTRRYLADLLDIDPATLDLDYEPDTFGHHANVPEVLSNAGVRYYYHCRGAEGPHLYRWQAPSGSSIIVCREPLWYNWDIDGRCAMIVPEFCQKHGLKSALRVYGVGDHGGGPTRRDIERIIEMNRWPIFPRYRFATYHDFFNEVSAVTDQLPVVRGELNFIFDGCYTSQSRIKKGNRHAEQAFYDAETASAMTHFILGSRYPKDDFTRAWKNVLFNQFHDILPGSGTADTREYAMGLYQEAFACINTQHIKALRTLAETIDTSGLAHDENEHWSRSEGAGVGYPTGFGLKSRPSWHQGRRRLFMVWNALPFEREELCDLTVWDWPGDCDRIQVRDEHGQILSHQLLNQGKGKYWGHQFQNLRVLIKVPATGYRTVVVDEMPLQEFEIKGPDLRKIKPAAKVLENEYLKVELSPDNATIVSFTDKETAFDYVADRPSGIFRLIKEDASRGMTAWTVGAYQKVHSLHRDVQFCGHHSDPLSQEVSWKTSFGHQSTLHVKLALHKGERMLRIQVKVNWQEIGSQSEGIPQLNFFMPLSADHEGYHYSIPMGQVWRPCLPHDVPATAYAMAVRTDGDGRPLMLVSDSKYGFRGTEEGLAMTLIRSSFDPDPWPEVGAHEINMVIGLVDDVITQPARLASAFNTPLQALSLKQGQQGERPLQASLFSLSGKGLFVSAVKAAEDGSALIVRLYSQSDQPETALMSFWANPARVILTDVMEQPLKKVNQKPDIQGSTVRVTVPAYSLLTVRIEWNEP